MTLVVGHPTRRNDRSAISLGAMLARSLDTDLLVVSVVPARWPTTVAGNIDREYAAWSRAEGEAAVADAQAILGEVAPDLDARVVSLPGRSVAAVLIDQARAVGAGLVVVGSASSGPWNRVVIGSTAGRLLHSSPVPVAVAPRGFATHAALRFDRATCAFRADETSRVVLRRTAEICAASGARLRVVTFGVLGRTMYPPEVRGEEEILEAFVEQASAAQRAAVAELPVATEAECVVSTGRTWAEAVTSLSWQHGDILVLGSSSGGALRRVFLGSDATRIVRHSPVPVVVVPA